MATFRWEWSDSGTVIIPKRQGNRVPVRQVTETSSARLCPLEQVRRSQRSPCGVFPGVDITLSPEMKAVKRVKRKYARIFSFDEQGDCTQSVQIQMRSKAVVSGIPITTTIAAITSTVEGLEDRLVFNSGCYKTPKASLSHGNSAKASLPSLRRDKHDFGRFEVCSLQEYHRHVKK